MINIFVGYDLANRFKATRDRLPGRTTDTEFMVILLNTFWEHNKEQIDGYTSGRTEQGCIEIQADLSLGRSVDTSGNEQDIQEDKAKVHRGAAKQAKGTTPKRSKVNRKSV